MELEFWGKRNGIDQFRVKSIAGRNIVSDHVLLISFDGSEARDMALDAVVTGKEHSEYFGKIEMLYCKRQQGHYGTEKLKTEKIDKVILSKEQWENETGKIKLLELWNCIQFETGRRNCFKLCDTEKRKLTFFFRWRDYDFICSLSK